MPVDAFADEMWRAGFQAIRATRTDHTKPERLRDFLEYAESRHRASQLMAIPDAAYAEGLERVRRDLAASRDPDVAARSEFVVVRVIGDRF